MCTNYAPVQRQILRDIFGVEPPPADWKPEAWPDYAAPIVRMMATAVARACWGASAWCRARASLRVFVRTTP